MSPHAEGTLGLLVSSFSYTCMVYGEMLSSCTYTIASYIAIKVIRNLHHHAATLKHNMHNHEYLARYIATSHTAYIINTIM